MAWDVRLQDENGKPVIERDACIEFSMIPVDPTFKLLRYVDKWGDTYFNRIQIEDFLVDWTTLRPTDHERKEWEFVLQMATRCRDDVHLYLRFIGE